jgi:hypothetical protein
MVVVLRLDDRDRDVRLKVENEVGLLRLAATDQFSANDDPPFGEKTSSRICNISSQPARFRAGRMNFVQISRSVRLRLSIAQPESRGSFKSKLSIGTKTT